MDMTPDTILTQAVAVQEAGTMVEKIDSLQAHMLELPQVKLSKKECDPYAGII